MVWTLAAMLGSGVLLLAGLFQAAQTNIPIWILAGFLFSIPIWLIFIFLVINQYHDIVITDRNIYWIRWMKGRISGETQVPLESVTSVVIKQSKAGKLFKYGDVIIQLAVPPNSIRLRWIPAPDQFQDFVQKAILQRQKLSAITNDDVQSVLDGLQKAYEQHLIDKEQFQYSKNRFLSQQM